MDFNIIDLITITDQYLLEIIQFFGMFTYLILFLLVFSETGFVVTPFLPGDSLLFACGAVAAANQLNIFYLFAIFCVAAIGGDSLNYEIGRYLGPKIFTKKNLSFFKREHLEYTQQFYQKHGAKTIVIGRFIPIIRTFAPFVAGIAAMSYRHFIGYNIIGGLAWVSIFLAGGYFFGTLPFVKNHFSLVIVGIVVVSLIPALIGYFQRTKRGS